MRPQLDHVSIAVHDIGRASEVFRRLELTVGARQEFESENTAEAYVETAPVRLLLQQPRSLDGPLARHLQRRGPGFHHLAFGVADVEHFSAGLGGSGWLMTPSSLLLRRRAGTIWLVKPEAGLLVEVFERREPATPPAGHTFHHVAIVSPGLDLVKRLMGGLGLIVPAEAEPDPAMGCDVLEVTGAGASLSIKIPTPGQDGPLQRFLEQRGPGIHHVGLPVPDVLAAGMRLRGDGIRVVPDLPLATPRGPRWYIHPADSGGALIELGS